MASPRERLLAVLAHKKTDQSPFNIWNNKIPDGTTLNALLERAACITVKSNAYTVNLDGIRTETVPFATADGTTRYRIICHTPAGSLQVIQRPMPGTVWVEKHWFTDPGDYDALECLVASRRYVPCSDQLLQDDAQYPGQSIARPGTLHAPLHVIINELLGVPAFCIEWFENRERIERLHTLLMDDMLRQVQLLAASPALYCVVDGNTQFDILGPGLYEQYSMPYIEAACEILHAEGKYAGAHLDGNNLAAAPLIARTHLDFIESLSPPPACDLSLADARKIWPHKGIIVNFPSSEHLAGTERVRAVMQSLRSEAGDLYGVAVGVIENIPHNDYLILLAEEMMTWKAACT